MNKHISLKQQYGLKPRMQLRDRLDSNFAHFNKKTRRISATYSIILVLISMLCIVLSCLLSLAYCIVYKNGQ